MNTNRIQILHPYIEGRLNSVKQGHYPKHHLWAIDAFGNNKLVNQTSIFRKRNKIGIKLEQFFNHFFFRGSPGLRVEFFSLLKAKEIDLIYSVCGPLALACLYPNKLVSWVFSMPPCTGRGIKISHMAYKSFNLRANAGFLCLTQKAENFYSEFAPAKFIPWCVDLELFDGAPPKMLPEKPFFLATGKTYRDYATLVKAAKKVATEIRIIGPTTQKPEDLPSNVKWIDTSSNPPDQAIDYPTLREWYAQCIAVCIPLSGDADDTCGYTNMLEAMAMRKPVMMTQSGCLHINPKTDGFGLQLKQRDAQGWTQAMHHLLKDHEKALGMGNRGREIVERDFTIERFNKDVLEFIEAIQKKVERRG